MEPDADHEDVISRLDALIEPAGEPENAIITDDARLVRWAGPGFALTADAWFDVMTTPGNERLESVLLCFFVELPLAALCLWLSHHTLEIAERRAVLLRRLVAGTAGGRRRLAGQPRGR